MPLSRSALTAASMSPPVSSRARLQSIMPAWVRSRSSFTSAAVGVYATSLTRFLARRGLGGGGRGLGRGVGGGRGLGRCRGGGGLRRLRALPLGGRFGLRGRRGPRGRRGLGRLVGGRGRRGAVT